MDSALGAHAVDLLWSLWTELGVPGPHRRHGRLAVDPEPLIVVSPWIAAGDARLRDEVHRWCAAHADRISVSRLQGLLRRTTPDVRSAFGAFAATLAASSGVRWPTEPSDVPWPRAPDPKPPTLPTARPSLVRLRVRALAGVGARADVVAELLARAGTWTVASDLEFLGYSKRNVARVLAELGDAGLVKQLARGNTRSFRLDQDGAWMQLLHVEALAWPSWDEVMRLVIELLALPDLAARSAAVRRVEAAKAAERLRPLADALGIEVPPPSRGEADVAARLLTWGEDQLRQLADGATPALEPWRPHGA